jgi:Na+/H+ antiporter NhaD/arsenite permease-like protein
MQLNPTILSDARGIAAWIVFFCSYFVFALGKFPGLKIDRPGAAIIGAVLMVAFRIMTAQEALRTIDFSTIVLLFSMTLIVAHLHLGGFFEWVADLTVLRLNARQLLAAVVFTSGILSAFLVNDVVCLVMTPFIIGVTRRLALEPVPYLLALATASNIGSVATITGNPQNMLIGSVSQIGYVDFLVHLGPVALVGLCLDWALLHWLYLRVPRPAPVPAVATVCPSRPHRPRLKPVVVLGVVLAGFLAGVPPALMAALGAAALLITRTTEPRLVYDEVDWGLLVFRTLHHRGGRRAGGTHGETAAALCRMESASHLDLFVPDRAAVEYRQQRAGRGGAEGAGARIPRSARRLVDTGDVEHPRRKPHDHRFGSEYHRGGARAARGAGRLS